MCNICCVAALIFIRKFVSTLSHIDIFLYALYCCCLLLASRKDYLLSLFFLLDTTFFYAFALTLFFRHTNTCATFAFNNIIFGLSKKKAFNVINAFFVPELRRLLGKLAAIFGFQFSQPRNQSISINHNTSY